MTDNEATKPARNILAFFILTFILSLPIYLLAFLVPPEMAMLVGLMLTLAPISAALILTFRQDRSAGAKKLVSRAFDFKRIPHAKWYLAIIFLWPLIFSLALVLLVILGEPVPNPVFPVIAAPLGLLVFFFLALFEEVGWMGYAFDPMENRWNAVLASLVLGAIWAIWHLPIFIATPENVVWVAGQIITLVVVRVLIVWIFNNAGKSLFAAILFHAVYNVCTMVFPVYGSSFGPAMTALIAILTAVIVLILWGPNTLARFRFSKAKIRRAA
jgi:membrane protease YdiL (CAAX protease family)